MYQNLIDELKQIPNHLWMSIYLKILALAFAYGASVHLANILGLEGQPWLQTPLAWRIGDVFYGTLDILAAIGLWQKRLWGIGCFLVAVVSQLIIYTVFIDHFASTPEQIQTIYSLLGTETIFLAIFAILLVFKK